MRFASVLTFIAWASAKDPTRHVTKIKIALMGGLAVRFVMDDFLPGKINWLMFHPMRLRPADKPPVTFPITPNRLRWRVEAKGWRSSADGNFLRGTILPKAVLLVSKLANG